MRFLLMKTSFQLISFKVSKRHTIFKETKKTPINNDKRRVSRHSISGNLFEPLLTFRKNGLVSP